MNPRYTPDPRYTDTTQGEAADRNETVLEEGTAILTDKQRGLRTTRARSWAYLYLATFGDESDGREINTENESADPADTVRD